MSGADAPHNVASGPVLFAYDGSDLAQLAIDEAGRLLTSGLDALVVCVWQPFDVGFVINDGPQFNTEEASAVRAAATRTAAAGVKLAQAAGFHAQALEIEAAPIWKGIVDVAEEHDARVVVLGSHSRTGLSGLFVGSVASAVSTHCHRTVLITHRRD